MNFNFIVTFEAIFIIMLIVVALRQDPDKLFHCSRDRSKIVRDVIHKKFIPIFKRYEIELSPECPFNPEREYLWWPVQTDDFQHENSIWSCPFCGLQFFCSERLIFHWDTEHRYAQQYREDLICLADYCGIFRCDIIMKKMLQRQKRFLNYITFSDTVNNNGLDAAKCDRDQMNVLQEMCQNVIHQCTIGNEFNVSSQTIWTLRKELSESICSYLTCEHYHDDLFNGDNTSRKVPIILFSTIGAIMLTGFFLLYHFIWNAFKRGLIKENNIQDVCGEMTANTEFGSRAKKTSNRTMMTNIRKNLAHHNNNHNGNNLSASSPDKFFEHIFEFYHEKYEDPYEYHSDYDTRPLSKFKTKRRPINSIIEEEEEEQESEVDLSVNSYPAIGRKYTRKNMQKPDILLAKQRAVRSMTQQQQQQIRNSQPNIAKEENQKKPKAPKEIFLQEFQPMKFHSKYIQPIKPSFSDQSYPCYSGPMVEHFPRLSDKSRSFSHSYLRNAHRQHARNRHPAIRRQYSIDDEWRPRCQEPPSRLHLPPAAVPSLPSSQTLSPPPPPLPPPPPPPPIPLPVQQPPQSFNARQFPYQYQHHHHRIMLDHGNTHNVADHLRPSKSAMSYQMMHPSRRREIYASSKTNSDASIGSGSSRYTAKT